MNRLWSSAAALAIITGYLYCASTAKYHGNIQALNLNSQVLQRNFHQIIYDGFLTAGPPLAAFLAFFAAYRLIYSYFLLLRLVDYFRVKNDLRRQNIGRLRDLAEFKKKFRRDRRDTMREVISKKNSKCIVGAVAVLLVSIFSFLHFEHVGRDAAESIKSAVAEGNMDSLTYVQGISSKNSGEFVFLTCGNELCALLDPDTGYVRYVPPEEYTFSSGITERAQRN